MSYFKTTAERYLSDLIAIPTVTGSEGLIKGYLEGAFRSAGAEVSLQYVDTDRHNVIAKIGEGPVKLMLCTHTDVVPATGWNSDPFRAHITDGRIYGRGATDAKGSLAAMMEAMLRVKNSGKKLNGSLALAAVIEEETGKSIGAKKILEGYAPENVIIGEPTGLRVATAHKGALRPSITVKGKAAHASNPDGGVNAIMLMGRVVKSLGDYGRKVSQRYDPLLGKPSFEITMINGGERINMIPDRCRVFADRRLISDETIESSYDELKNVIMDIEKDIGASIDTELVSSYPSSCQGACDMITALSKVLERKNMPSSPVGFLAGCDMWAFRSKGIPTVILGPGSLEQAHTTDEYIERQQLNAAASIYEDIIYALLT